MSLDPHAYDYPTVSDYSYVLGNPLAFIDKDGKDVILLLMEDAPFGTGLSGHTAVLIGNDQKGWVLYNKTGGANADGTAEVASGTFDTVDKFYEAYGSAYQKGIQIATSEDDDELMRQTAVTEGPTPYEVSSTNCQDFCRQVVESGGIDMGDTQKSLGITWPRKEFQKVVEDTNGTAHLFLKKPGQVRKLQAEFKAAKKVFKLIGQKDDFQDFRKRFILWLPEVKDSNGNVIQQGGKHVVDSKGNIVPHEKND